MTTVWHFPLTGFFPLGQYALLAPGVVLTDVHLSYQSYDPVGHSRSVMAGLTITDWHYPLLIGLVPFGQVAVYLAGAYYVLEHESPVRMYPVGHSKLMIGLLYVMVSH